MCCDSAQKNWAKFVSLGRHIQEISIAAFLFMLKPPHFGKFQDCQLAELEVLLETKEKQTENRMFLHTD